MADVEDQWLKQALKNDNLVAQLLFRLKRSSPLANPPALRWGRRGRRSNPHPVPAVVRKKEIIEKARCSPSTPLSWSGGSDSNESRRRRLLKAKSAFASESPMATTSKKSTKKPSFGELKDKQIQLLKEKVHLKKNIASLHVTMKEQKARKEKLNKLKLRVKIPPADKSEKTPSEPVAPLSNRGNQTKSSPIGQALPISQKHAMGDNGIAPSSSSLEQMDVNPRESCFDIPDLNTMPLENEQVPKALITQRS